LHSTSVTSSPLKDLFIKEKDQKVSASLGLTIATETRNKIEKAINLYHVYTGETIVLRSPD